jgi:hypothetical protein
MLANPFDSVLHLVEEWSDPFKLDSELSCFVRIV